LRGSVNGTLLFGYNTYALAPMPLHTSRGRSIFHHNRIHTPSAGAVHSFNRLVA
jgi:hypothetical protein